MSKTLRFRIFVRVYNHLWFWALAGLEWFRYPASCWFCVIIAPYLVYYILREMAGSKAAFGLVTDILFLVLATWVLITHFYLKPDPPGTIDGQLGMGQALAKFCTVFVFVLVMGSAHLFTLLTADMRRAHRAD